jgi:hypothetical protein
MALRSQDEYRAIADALHHDYFQPQSQDEYRAIQEAIKQRGYKVSEINHYVHGIDDPDSEKECEEECCYEGCAYSGRTIKRGMVVTEHCDYSYAHAGFCKARQYDQKLFHLSCWTVAFKDDEHVQSLCPATPTALHHKLTRNVSRSLDATQRSEVKAAVASVRAGSANSTTPKSRKKRTAFSGEKIAKVQRSESPTRK